MPRSSRLARGVSEFIVIFVGVILALAADRWITAADERDDAAFYRAQLEADVRADSVRLEGRIRQASQRAEVALTVLRTLAGEDIVSESELGRIAADFKTLGSFSPLDYNRTSWDELVASGRVSLIADPGLRGALRAYYDDLEAFAQTESEWDVALRQLEEQVMLSGDPMRHLVLWGAALPGIDLPEPPEGDDYSGPRPSAADFIAMVEGLREDRSLQNRLAHARVIWTVARYTYGARLERNEELIERLSAWR